MAERSSRGGKEHLLQVQLDILTSQNTRLTEENNLLRHKLARLASDQRTNGALNVEAKIKALQFEDERDRLFESLERLKKKYNKLHLAYLEKVQRCKALEDTFQRQKTLTGLVYKTTSGQRARELAAVTASENLEKQVAQLQAALEEAHDIIDELEFEVDSVEYLEIENQRLRNEVADLKTKQKKVQTEVTSMTKVAAAATKPIYDDEPPPSYSVDEIDIGGATATGYDNNRLSTASSISESICNDDADSETLERAAMTHSLLVNAEAESKQLQRELLKCRLRDRKK